jgi:mRNA-degrading endonuclease RelE of RelBE toxin-antitoxin system
MSSRGEKSLPPLKIDLTAPTFSRDLADAVKRHRSVKADLQSALQSLENDPGIGDWIPGLGEEVRKLRIGVKKDRIGKSKGYRLIYKVDRQNSVITPLFFHFKPDLALVPIKEIAEVLKNLSATPPSPPPDISGPVN